MNNSSTIKEIVLKKIDVFMHNNIISAIDPNKVYWWFSLSGGKDSFTMAYALYLWYKENNYSFNGEGIYIKQWGETGIYNHLCKSIDWMPITRINGEEQTLLVTNYKQGNQAPCSACSSVRKLLGDKYITENYKDGFYNIISRGLHLTDMTISYLWRNYCGIDTVLFAKSLNKGKPFEKLELNNNLFLAKPLCLVREYECEQFARLYNYIPVCCGCPACRYPSRRDIVEESLSLFFHNDLWEFDIYGISSYLHAISAPEIIKDISLPGKETKCARLSSDFCTFAYKYWKLHEKGMDLAFDNNRFLDDIGNDFIVNHIHCLTNKLYLPKFFSGEELSREELMMIATVGPFWGAAGYHNKDFKEFVFSLQAEIFGIRTDHLWTQVNPILQDYYKETNMPSNGCFHHAGIKNQCIGCNNCN